MSDAIAKDLEESQNVPSFVAKDIAKLIADFLIPTGRVITDNIQSLTRPNPTFAGLAQCFGIPKCAFCERNANRNTGNAIFSCFTTTLNLKSHGDYQPKLTCYLLTSLRDHSINYIGTTTQKLSDRLAYHNTGTSHLEGCYPQKGPWICTAIAVGFGNDVDVMKKFHRLWKKEKELAATARQGHRLSFDLIAKIGRIISRSSQFNATPIQVNKRFKFPL